MEKVKLSHVVKYRKQFIEISDQKTYKRCRVQLHRRGVKLRDVVAGEAIKTKKQRVCKENDFIVAEMDAKFGGYGIIPKELDSAVVSSHYYLYELEKSKIFPAYLNILIDSGVFQEQIKAVGSTNYSRVSAKEVLEYEIHCPDLDAQIKIIDFYCKSKEKWCGLHSETIHQQTLLKKLRQSILQEAIEGKLTSDWRKQNPDVEPASELLERIQAEKEQLIKDKKIKKQKPLPPISEEEKPFALPEGWVWCRLQDITRLITDGKHGDCQNLDKSGYYFLSAKDIQNGELIYRNARQIVPDEFQEVHNRTDLEVGDICMVNTGATVGKLALAPDNPITQRTTFQKSVAVIKVVRPFIDQRFIGLLLTCETSKLLATSWGSAINNLLLGDLKKQLVSLPPLSEQKAIVTKVEKLLAICDQLEQQITTAQADSEGLMQAVLKEAFQRDRPV